MTFRGTRWLGIALVAVICMMAAACSSDDTPLPPEHSSTPPAELVGTWNGGPGESSDWYLTITEDGNYRLVNDELGWTDAGYVDTSPSNLVAYSSTGNSRVLDAAAFSGCQWRINKDAGLTMLMFCGSRSTWLPAQLPN